MSVNLSDIPNPTGLTIPTATSYLNRYAIFDRRGFKPIRRFASNNKTIRDRFEASGGLENVFARDAHLPESREAVSRIGELQNMFILDKICNGDISTTPSLEEMFEIEKGNRKGITDIGVELKHCCDDIRELLKQLSRQLQVGLRDLEKYMRKLHNRTYQLIEKIRDNLYTFYREEKRKYLEGVIRQKRQVLIDIRTMIKEEWQPVKDKISALNSKIDNYHTNITHQLGNIEVTTGAIQTELEVVAGEVSTIAVEVPTIISGILTPVGSGLGGVASLVEGVQFTLVNKWVPTKSVLDVEFKTAINTIDEHVDEKQKELHEYLEKAVKNNINCSRNSIMGVNHTQSGIAPHRIF